jgi:uncharacterized protein (DUF2141 family)
MSKLRRATIATLVAAAMPLPAFGATLLGADAEACAPDARGAALLVRVDGFKLRSGVLRVQLYGANPADFLAKGKRLRRIDLPVTAGGPMEVCVALPGGGTYAVAVRHDVNGNGSDWNDGGGFSRNPKLSVLAHKPAYRDVMINVGGGVTPVDIMLYYRQGLSIRPITMAER